MVTIKDVARIAGVSIATVSRTLAEPDKVSDKTRDKVMEAVESSGYVTNSLARNFRRRRSNMVLVLVPNIANPYFASLIQGIEQVAIQHQFQILLGDTQQNPEFGYRYADLASQKLADAIICFEQNLPASLARSVPIVMACEYSEELSCPTVCIDNVGAAQEAAEHLLELGHRKIAYINGPDSSQLSGDRLAGYRRALEQAGIAVSAKWICKGDYGLQSGYDCMQSLLELSSQPTAVFCANDEMAIGAMRACQDQGMNLPADMSFIGFDDIALAGFTQPRLTTVHQPRTQIGEQAMAAALALLNGERLNNEKIVLPHRLVIRESTTSPN